MQQEVDTQGRNLQYGYGGTGPNNLGTGGFYNLYNNLSGDNAFFRKNYENSVTKGMQSYDDIMSAYKNFSGSPDMESARSAYTSLANGGNINMAAIRDRAMAPTRAAYENAIRNLNKQRSLQGGYSPGYTTALTRMARQQGQGAADAANSAEAAIAELLSRNQIAGAGGLSDLANKNLAATDAMRGLYGTAPGMATMFGNQLGLSNNQMLDTQNLQNQIADLLMKGRYQTGQLPGNFQTIMDYIGQGIGLAGKAAGAMSGLGGGYGIQGAVNNTANAATGGAGSSWWSKLLSMFGGGGPSGSSYNPSMGPSWNTYIPGATEEMQRKLTDGSYSSPYKGRIQ